MIVIVDYGMGNLRSAQKGFEKVGFEAIVSSDPADIERADGVVLPGVGAFADCYAGLAERNFIEPVKAAAASGRPFLGICVGMQLLFDRSEEGVGSEGLGILPGTVVRFPMNGSSDLKVPHMGWNQLRINPDRPCPLLTESTEPYVYFVHSYFPKPENESDVYAYATHGVEFPAIVGRDNVFGSQFHPEKSQQSGLSILKAFGELTNS